jgi:hypothetical protein
MAQGKVTASTLNLRTAPNTGSSILASLSTGEIVDILSTVTGGSYPVGSGISNQWHNVRVNRQTGFVAVAFVQPIASPGILQGNIESAPSGLIGFDCASKLTRSLIAKFVSDSKGFRYCLRYLSLKYKQDTSVDLSSQEAEDILASGLALSPVQRVRKADWVPTNSLGTTTGQNAANNAISVGFPPGINVWLDLEGVKAGTPASNVIGYCNNWFDEVKAKNYIPGIYVGADAILTGTQLANLKFQHYWKSGSIVPNIPGQGYQLIQTIPSPPLGEFRHGIHIDYDKTQTDSLGGQVIWLRR